MEPQDLTLALRKEVLRKAKQKATEENTPPSALITTLLAEYVGRGEAYEEARRQSLELMERRLPFNPYGKIDWTRDEQHERLRPAHVQRMSHGAKLAHRQTLTWVSGLC